MSPLSTTFTEKVLSKIDKLDRSRVERFVRDVVRERNFYQVIFDELGEGIVVTDPDGRVLMLNRHARLMLHLGAKQRVLGRPLLEVVRDDELRTLLANWRGERIEQRSIFLDPPAPQETLLTLLSVDESVSEEPLARVMILTDVTEHRRREREQARAERLSSLALLTAGVAHEIKNPLNSLRIHTQLLSQAIALREDGGDEQSRRNIRSAEIIVEETERLAKIVEQFMQAVRPVEPNLRRHNLNVILRRVMESLASGDIDPDLSVEWDLDTELPDIWVDDTQMAQVFQNLIRNACESFDKPMHNLRLSTRVEEKTALVTIADNGCGISREDLERIYQPYFTTKFNGTGLGLMVVHRIVAEHGGRIIFQSRECEGTEVTLIFPLDRRPPRLLTQEKTDEGTP